MSPELPMLLTVFEHHVAANPSILGMLYTGSLGGGTTDHFSDLDIVLWLADACNLTSIKTRDRILQYLGDLHFVYGTPSAATAFVGPSWQRVDLNLYHAADLQPAPKYAQAAVVKDTSTYLATLVATSPTPSIAVTDEQAASALAEAVDSQIYLALHNARGATWSAIGEISYRCAELYTLLARLRGVESFGFRYVEYLLTPDERQILEAAWPSAPTRTEVQRAARALWDWTKVVWQEVEHVVPNVRVVQVDEAGLLTAVEHIYHRR